MFGILKFARSNWNYYIILYFSVPSSPRKLTGKIAAGMLYLNWHLPAGVQVDKYNLRSCGQGSCKELVLTVSDSTSNIKMNSDNEEIMYVNHQINYNDQHLASHNITLFSEANGERSNASNNWILGKFSMLTYL